MSEAAIRQYLDGAIPANIALMRLAMSSASPGEVERALARADSSPEQSERLQALAAMWRDHPDFWSLAKTLQATVNHSAGAGDSAPTIAGIGEAFDRAAAISGEASVALYSLGDPVLLDQATQEVVAFMTSARLFDAKSRVLDIGCGTGRFEAALAPRVHEIVALEVSRKMTDAARLRCSGLANVVVETRGDPPDLPEASFDLAIAIDSFPYIVQAGIAATWFEALGRLLREGGQLLIANYAYRDDPARDAAEIGAFGRAFGLEAVSLGERPFRLWDGAVFRLRRIGTPPPEAR